MVVIGHEDVEKDHDDNFHSDLVDNCMDILQLPANRSTAAALPHNVTPITQPQPQPSQPILTPIQNPQHISQPHPLSFNVTPIQNPPQHSQSRPLLQPQWEPLSAINNIPGDTPLHSQGQQRPQFGGKCPRRRQLELSPEDHAENLGCSSYKRLKEEVLNLRRQLAAYGMQNDQATPKPGKVLPAIANQFKMIELSPGSAIYVFDKHIEQAVARKSPTACAAFLLNCFYNNKEIAGMNLTGANGKPHPDKDIIDSIIAFTMKKHATTAAVLKASLRNKFAATTSRARKFEHQ